MGHEHARTTERYVQLAQLDVRKHYRSLLDQPTPAAQTYQNTRLER